MTEKLVNASIKLDADIVTCDFYRNNLNDYYYEKCHVDTNNNFNNIGLGHDCTVWNKIYRREIIAPIKFPICNKFEDEVITQQAYFYAKKIIHISYPLYHYFNNFESMTYVQNENTVYQYRDNIIFTINFLRENLKERFIFKKKEINQYVNDVKLRYNKYIPFINKIKFFKFYPESGFLLFLLKKTIRNIIINILPYGLYKLIKNILKNKK
jgi:hypothetical protein